MLNDRAIEMKWMVKGTLDYTKLRQNTTETAVARINSVIFTFLWACAPILVSIAAFFAYVMSGHQLTISTAFTVREYKAFAVFANNPPGALVV